MMASAGYNLTREAKETSIICHKLMHEVLYNGNQDKVRHVLTSISQQVEQHTPRISAAGFFNINYSYLLNVFGVVLTHLIVLLQFISK